MLNTDSIYNTRLHARFHRCKRRHATSLCAHTSQRLTVMSLLQLQNNNDYATIHTAHSPLSLIWHTRTQTGSKPTNGQLWVAVKPITLYTAYTVYMYIQSITIQSRAAATLPQSPWEKLSASTWPASGEWLDGRGAPNSSPVYVIAAEAPVLAPGYVFIVFLICYF